MMLEAKNCRPMTDGRTDKEVGIEPARYRVVDHDSHIQAVGSFVFQARSSTFAPLY